MTAARAARSGPPAPRKAAPSSGIVRRVLDPGVLVPLAVLITVWFLASLVAPAYSVPPLSAVGAEMWRVVSDGEALLSLVTTLLRVGAGLVGAFVFGTALGMAMGASTTTARYLLGPIRFIQGIPSVSWAIIAVIWFSQVEVRVFAIMLLVTLPGFALQLYDSYRAIPADLLDMGRSFRPSRWLLFREVQLPAVTPGIFTAWKVNLGLGIRVVLIAELVGATVGVGAQLLSAQQLFDMASVIAWTVMLALCMLLLQALIELVENRVLRYRAQPGDAESDTRERTGGRTS